MQGPAGESARELVSGGDGMEKGRENSICNEQSGQRTYVSAINSFSRETDQYLQRRLADQRSFHLYLIDDPLQRQLSTYTYIIHTAANNLPENLLSIW